MQDRPRPHPARSPWPRTGRPASSTACPRSPWNSVPPSINVNRPTCRPVPALPPWLVQWTCPGLLRPDLALGVFVTSAASAEQEAILHTDWNEEPRHEVDRHADGCVPAFVGHLGIRSTASAVALDGAATATGRLLQNVAARAPVVHDDIWRAGLFLAARLRADCGRYGHRLSGYVRLPIGAERSVASGNSPLACFMRKVRVAGVLRSSKESECGHYHIHSLPQPHCPLRAGTPSLAFSGV